MIPDLDRAFASGTLHDLRAEALALACRAGLSQSRAMDVVLAVHELAANAVRHGAGTGRLRIWKLAEALCCQVDDGDPPASEDPASGPTAVSSWPSMPGHGLWVVARVADHMHVAPGPSGSSVRITFALP